MAPSLRPLHEQIVQERVNAMSARRERVMKAFAHEESDRTPLFEIFQPFHPIHCDASHSVHEDVKPENYHAAIAAYREYFGLEPLPEHC